ncbi:hypothetical protein ACFLYS_03895, partial [Chloroflexota bacterium]
KMKKVILLTLTLVIMLGCTGFTACGGEKGGLTWNDIPIYPDAELLVSRSWPVPPEEEISWSEVEWHYYLAGDKYSVSEIASFYESEMPARGWQDKSEMELGVINDALWSYHNKINLYTQADIAGRMGSWGYYSKNDDNDWAAIWMGINREWEEADKVFIVIMIAR